MIETEQSLSFFIDKYKLVLELKNMVTPTAGYGHTRRLLFYADEAKYGLWEANFLGYKKLP